MYEMPCPSGLEGISSEMVRYSYSDSIDYKLSSLTHEFLANHSGRHM
jgi:hypothetical protein